MWIRAIDMIESDIRGREQISFPARCVKALLETSQGETEYLLGSLSSLIGIVNNKGELEFRLYHKSFLDFLDAPDRGADLHVDYGACNQFVSARCLETLKSKAPQVALPSNDAKKEFDSFFAQTLPYLIYHNFCRSRFDSGDVYWWITNHPSHSRDTAILIMFSGIHKNCGRFRCLSACRVWRKTILGFCKDNGWRVPSPIDRLLEDFRATTYVYYPINVTPTTHPKSPLRPPQPTIRPPVRLGVE
ncbi:hypothetical protein FA13DRAFT_1732466 [Coprinellus micaceus]|uniref:Uncharacterized protein n=1 Tax=Coprinellus micaceus TaxID=71717 RepID=A0A4Y7TC97_COPMI|nr:hypothetical protein FA13DRAFT_1732466 [Coprinellus micaceus]